MSSATQPGSTPSLSLQPTLLCVDDEVNGLLMRKLVLQSAGFSVLTAENGQAALDLFATQDIACVVLDYLMPGMNGGAVASRMRELKPLVPIIMLSAYVSLPVETLTVVDEYVTKGQSPLVLIERVRQVLRAGGHHHRELDGEYVVFLNLQRHLIGCTHRLCDLLAYSEQEMLRLTLDDIVDSPDVPASFREYVHRREQQGFGAIRRKDGSTINIQYQARIFPDGCMVSHFDLIQADAD